MDDPVAEFFHKLGRIAWRYALLVLAWLAFTLWNAREFLRLMPQLSSPSEPSFDRFGLADPIAGALALNFWGLAAALVFGMMVKNPFGWLNGKRLAIGITAFFIMMARLFGGGLLTLGLQYLPVPPIIVFVAMPLTLFLTSFFVLLAFIIVSMLLWAAFVGAPIALFQQLRGFENELARYQFQVRGLSNYIVRFVYWLRNEPLPPAPPDESKGAREATPEEIKALYNASPGSMAFGHIGAPLFIKTDKHVLIMASTRSGKGVSLIIPHLLRYQGSAFVLDPKGENARATGRQRAALNQKVHYLDPFGISGKRQSRFNPLSRFTPENMEAEAKALAAAMFVVRDEKRDHWTDAGQQLLTAIILFVYCSPDIPSFEKDLPQVRKQLLGNVQPALDAMLLLDDGDGLLRDLANSFLQTPDKELGSIISTAQRQTEILDNPFIVKCLKATRLSESLNRQGEEVDFAQWRKGTMTVFLCLSAPKFPTFNRWLRLVLTSALDEMTDRLVPPPLPVCFMLDELATLGHLAAIENAVGLSAGYGIQLVYIFQDVGQMKDLYNKRWPSFIGNAGVRAIFSLEDFDSAEYWSKFIGNRLVATYSAQQDLYGFSKGGTAGEAMRPMIPPEKLMFDYAKGWMLVLASGAHPFVTKRVAYFKDQGLDGTWDDPRGPLSPPSSPRPPTGAPPVPPSPWGTRPDAPTPPRPNGGGVHADAVSGHAEGRTVEESQAHTAAEHPEAKHREAIADLSAGTAKLAFLADALGVDESGEKMAAITVAVSNLLDEFDAAVKVAASLDEAVRNDAAAGKAEGRALGKNGPDTHTDDLARQRKEITAEIERLNRERGKPHLPAPIMPLRPRARDDDDRSR
jgi:type IV secretion system protein VirD4